MKNYVLKNSEILHLPKNATHPVIRDFLQNYTKGVAWETIFDAEENTLYFGQPCEISADGEDYALKVTPDGAFVRGSTYAGLMRGFTFLLEKIVCTDFEEYTVEGGEEKNSPKIAFRSAHICVFPETTLDFLRKTIRLGIMGRYSHLIIEFWGTLKMDCFPLLGWKDAYTKAEIKSIMDEARAFGIELIPFFQHWGHAALSREGASGKHVVLDQDIRYEYLYKAHTGGWVWDYNNPKTLELLKSAREELCELCGEGEYFHIGCDESEQLKTVEDAATVAEHINTVAADLKQNGRRAIVWGDMLLSKKFFKEGNQFECNSTPEIANALLDALDKDIIIADWQYNVTEGLIESSKFLKDRGFDVICCPFDKRTNTKLCIDSTIEYDLLGFMKTTWHTLNSSNMAQFAYSGLSAYEGYLDAAWHPYSAFIDRATGILRKLSPETEYKTCGWKQRQIEV